MKSSQLERVFNLVRRTGDKCVIMDIQSDEVFTLMRLSDYEDLLDVDGLDGQRIEEMSEREMMQKVDRDIAYWRSMHRDDLEAEAYFSDFPTDSAESVDYEENEGTENELEPDGQARETASGENFSSVDEPSPEEVMRKVDDFSGSIKEESLADVLNDDEDRFLLEPV